MFSSLFNGQLYVRQNTSYLIILSIRAYLRESASEIRLVRMELVAYFCKQHTWKKHTIQTLEKVFKIFKRPIVLQVSIYFMASIRCGLAPGFVNYKKGALDSQPQVIKFTSRQPMVGGSLRVLRLIPSLKMVTMIQLKYC